MGAPPRIQLPPLRLVVLGDFSGAGDPALGPVEVEQGELDQVLVRFSRELTLEVPDLLAGGEDVKTTFVKVPVAGLSDLEPATVLEHLPQLRPVQELVQALEEHKGGDSGAVERAVRGCGGVPAMAGVCARVMRELGAAAPAPSPAPAPAQKAAARPQEDGGGDAVDRILGMVDMGTGGGGSPQPEAREEAAKSAVGALISGVVGGGKPAARTGATGGELGNALEDARGLMARQLWAVIHHPEFKRAEATWRGLRFLARQCKLGRGLQLDLLDVRRDDAAASFSRHVHEPELAGSSEVTPALVLVDFPVTGPEAGLGLLQELAELAEDAQVPLLASVELGFFGLTSREEMGGMRMVSGLLDGAEYTRFRALRDKACSRWLALASGRFLLREPYRQGSRGSAGLDEPAEALLWGAPAWMAAGLVARSQAAVGWPTEITGMEGGVVEDLPIVPYKGAGGERHIPLEAFVPQSLGDDQARAGFLAFTCAPEGDAAYLLRAPILYPPGRFTEQGATDNARQMATLGYQLLVSRLADLLGRHKAGLVIGKGEGEIKAGLQGFFMGIVGESGPGAGVVVRLGHGGGRMLAEINIRMGRDVMNGAEVNFTIPV